MNKGVNLGESNNKHCEQLARLCTLGKFSMFITRCIKMVTLGNRHFRYNVSGWFSLKGNLGRRLTRQTR